MKLHCPDCGTLVPAEDINLATTIAKCRQCNSVFNFADAVGAQQRFAPKPATPILPRTRVRVEEFAGTLRLTWRWFRAVHLFLVFFCIAWDSFLIFWYTMAFKSAHTPWIMVVFPIGHLAVGVGLTYATLAGLLNRTTITVTPQELAVRHFPLPWLGNRVIPAGFVVQLHCEQHVARSNEGQAQVSYRLFATLKDGTKVRLASNFDNVAEARTIEQQIERYLRIVDRPVVGEYRG